jgi:hypothetical protein
MSVPSRVGRHAYSHGPRAEEGHWLTPKRCARTSDTAWLSERVMTLRSRRVIMSCMRRRVAIAGVAVGLLAGSGGTALGYELSSTGAPTARFGCDAVHDQLRQVRDIAIQQLGAGAARANSLKAAALVLAYPSCFTGDENTAAYDEMRSVTAVG